MKTEVFETDVLIIGGRNAVIQHCALPSWRVLLYDGGICTRIDCVSLGVVVHHDTQRFYDGGEDFKPRPRRYAIR